ncbi:hypothetical protein L2X99_16230 [Microbacterium sp. KUDC0406]|uniref:hypothetical protein n=1 Tax=Microbacterium sp. KUDC0406 TaxID=2909588 RepID=UPI001F467B23|nr:hypothetical protein [Microbacterium sp. KUDC0406]UJP09899.1 hypothetical protein L2X99_16230 [Microbacterium sp. KUDC0406]
MPTPSSSTASVQDPNPAEPISELVQAADLIVYGTVESIDPQIEDTGADVFPAQKATVRVGETLKGEASGEIGVKKPADTWYYLADEAQDSYDGKHEGILVLKKADDGYELFGYVGLHDDSGAQRAFARVLGGQSERIPGATRAQLAEWAEKADIIVFAGAKGDPDDVTLRTPRVDFSASGTLTPIDVIKGDMPEPLEVVQGPQPDVPGGTWGFPVADGQTGVFFIDASSGTPTVINTTEPSLINRRQVPTGD